MELDSEFFKKNKRYRFDWDKIDKQTLFYEVGDKKVEITFQDFVELIRNKRIESGDSSDDYIKSKIDGVESYLTSKNYSFLAVVRHVLWAQEFNIFESTIYFNSFYMYEYCEYARFTAITEQGYFSMDFPYVGSWLETSIVEDTSPEKPFEKEILQKQATENEIRKKAQEKHWAEVKDKVPFPTKESLDNWLSSGKDVLLYSTETSEKTQIPYPEKVPKKEQKEIKKSFISEHKWQILILISYFVYKLIMKYVKNT